MFPNGYNMPFYSSYSVPSMGMGMGMGPRIGMRAGLGAAASRSGGLGLFSRLGGIRTINWQGLLSGASKTLGVVNQAIPIVKQVGPLYNNMKSMLRVASLFKDETDPMPVKSTNNVTKNETNINKTTDNTSTIIDKKENTIINNNYSNNPSFFI